ncbi:Ku protein [Streptomyces sp. NPDC057307]|uniref:non-homologous end joining protein Ku n=1 Tax=Streptomyces sp. NPDC057307 TaxID=3346096 RepID=UPI0036275CBC
MRSIWNGAISFGLVSIPIKLVNATESHSISFRQIHLADGGRIRYRKVCELDEEEVTSSEIGKAYEDADGSMIPITDDDLAQLPLPTAKTIDIVGFVPESSIDPLQVGSAYYIAANGVPAAKPYTLLREALKRSEKVAIAKFALRGRERLGMVRVLGDVIALHGLLWPDEIRQPEGVAPETEVSIRDAELDLADALMDTLGEVELESLHDDYREAVEELIASKAGGGELRAPEGAGERGGGKVLDLMAALEGSVRAAKESRGEGGGGGVDDGDGDGDHAEVTHLPTRKKAAGAKKATSKTTSKSAAKSTSRTASKTAEKKTPAKKAAAKKTATGRTAAKKSTAATKKTTAKKAPARKRSA